MVLAKETPVLVAGALYYVQVSTRNICMAGKNTPPIIGWKSVPLFLPFELSNSEAPLNYGPTHSMFKKGSQNGWKAGKNEVGKRPARIPSKMLIYGRN
jgi:hypothetical protein